MTADQDEQLVESVKRIAYLLDYLCRAVKEIGSRKAGVILSDFDPPSDSIRPRR